jgi:hypothetical protein
MMKAAKQQNGKRVKQQNSKAANDKAINLNMAKTL